jgi:hypothetical protein
MRARCAGAHPPGVAWPQRQKSGGVATVMRVGNCTVDATAAHRRRNVGDHGGALDGDEPQSLSANGKQGERGRGEQPSWQ